MVDFFWPQPAQSEEFKGPLDHAFLEDVKKQWGTSLTK